MKSENLPGKLIACLSQETEGRGIRQWLCQWASTLHKKWSVLAQNSQPSVLADLPRNPLALTFFPLIFLFLYYKIYAAL